MTGKSVQQTLGLDRGAVFEAKLIDRIQAQSLLHTLAGHDVTGRAQTGTGKTAAFLYLYQTNVNNATTC
jgi:hypothetical protein